MAGPPNHPIDYRHNQPPTSMAGPPNHPIDYRHNQPPAPTAEYFDHLINTENNQPSALKAGPPNHPIDYRHNQSPALKAGPPNHPIDYRHNQSPALKAGPPNHPIDYRHNQSPAPKAGPPNHPIDYRHNQSPAPKAGQPSYPIEHGHNQPPASMAEYFDHLINLRKHRTLAPTTGLPSYLTSYKHNQPPASIAGQPKSHTNYRHNQLPTAITESSNYAINPRINQHPVSTAGAPSYPINSRHNKRPTAMAESSNHSSNHLTAFSDHPNYSGNLWNNKRDGKESLLQQGIAYHQCQHIRSVILVHEENSNAGGFKKNFMETRLNNKTIKDYFPCTNWCFPTINCTWAPTMHGIRNEVKLDLWTAYERSVYKEEEQEIIEQLRRVLQPLLGIVERETKLVGPQNVFIGGVSHGSTAALHVFLGFQSDKFLGALGGFIGIDGAFPYHKDLRQLMKGPIFADYTLAYMVVNEIRGRLNLPNILKSGCLPPRCLQTPIFIGKGMNPQPSPESYRKLSAMLYFLGEMKFLHTIICDDLNMNSQMVDIINFLSRAGCISVSDDTNPL